MRGRARVRDCPRVEEDRAYRSGRINGRGYSPPPVAPLKKLRHRAAQGHADLLVVFSASSHYNDQANWLASTDALLLPAFFVPGRHATLTTNVDVFFMDVRSGCLYASYSDQTQTQNRYVQLGYEHNHGDELAKEHVQPLLPGVVDAAGRRSRRRIPFTSPFHVDSNAAR